MKITRLGDIKCKVGEGPLWDVKEQALYFVDIRAQQLHRYDPAGASIRSWTMPQQVGCLALRESGGAVVALEDGFYGFDFDREEITPLALVEKSAGQFNDGKTDRQGRFVAGTASGFAKPPSASIYSLAPGSGMTRIETGLSVSNGPCFSPDGQVFYVTDSRSAQIFAYDYDISTGELSNKRVFIDASDIGGGPDGATVDAEGYYYVAVAFAGKIVRFDPKGRQDRVIETPVPWPSSVMFGGPDLDRLFFTSIDGAVYDRPTNWDSGGLFVIDDLGYRGIAERRFAD